MHAQKEMQQNHKSVHVTLDPSKFQELSREAITHQSSVGVLMQESGSKIRSSPPAEVPTLAGTYGAKDKLLTR